MIQAAKLMGGATKALQSGRIDCYEQQRSELSEKKQEQSKSKGNALRLNRSHVLWIFTRLKSIYGNAWASLYVDEREINDAIDAWYAQLKTVPLSAIRRALGRVIYEKRKFPPSLAEFFDMCLPSREELGLLSNSAAYLAAASGDWSCDAVFNAVQEVGPYTVRIDPGAKKEFMAAYQRYVEMLRLGLPLPHRRPAELNLIPPPPPEHVKPHLGKTKDECINDLRKLRRKISGN